VAVAWEGEPGPFPTVVARVMMLLTLRSECVRLSRKIGGRYPAGAPVAVSPEGVEGMAQDPQTAATFDARMNCMGHRVGDGIQTSVSRVKFQLCGRKGVGELVSDDR